MAPAKAFARLNALLACNFLFEVNGLDTFYVMDCDLPKMEREALELEGGGQDGTVYQAGPKKITEFSITLTMTATGTVRDYFEEWDRQVDTFDVTKYYRDATVLVLGPNKEPSYVWDIEDAWPDKREWEKLDAKDKKKPVQVKITFRCNGAEPRPAG